jgi:purine-binding chemotaxis protein CheW
MGNEVLTEQDAHDEMFIEDDDESGQADKYLLFNLGDEVYGINIAHVTEIIEMQKITEVPDMPSFIKGVINLRGRVIPVMDLRLRFQMLERDYDDRTCVIIANMGTTSMGFIVDTVAEVHDIREGEIEAPPAFKEDAGRSHYISGLGKVGDRVTILIDVLRLLSERQSAQIAAKVE